MFFKDRILVYFLLLINLLLGGYSSVCAEEGNPQDTGLAYATGLFNDGKFEQALPLFRKLIEETPENKTLSYYYGACLVELDTFNEETKKHLLKAISGNTPDKIYYYVGKYFQNKELWTSAMKYFERFQTYGAKEEKKEIEVENLIALCHNKLNMQNQGTRPDSLSVSAVAESDSSHIPDKTKDIKEVPKTPDKEGLISFVVNSGIEYLKPEHFKEPQAREYFTEGLIAERQLNRSIARADSLRDVYSKPGANRDEIAEQILILEQESLTQKKQSNQLFNQARELEQAYWGRASQAEIRKFREDIARLKEQLANTAPEPEVKEELTEVAPEMLIQEEPYLLDEPYLPDKKPEEEPNEIIYRIQIGAYSRSLPAYVDRMYKKLSLIRDIEHYTDDRGVTVYTTGNLTNFEDAVRLQSQVRQEGVKDAFVVAYKNGKRITLKEAKELTNRK